MTHRTHFLSVAGAYTLWGVLPLYWHLLGAIPGAALVGIRILCSLLFLSALLCYRGNLRSALRELIDYKRLSIVLLSALLIAGNWLIYLWAMTHGKMLDAGLGYFICPVLTMLLGAAILGESLPAQRKLGALIISLGVLYQVWLVGSFPWVGVGLALSFAAYLVIRKRWPVDPFNNMFQEMLVLAPLGVLILFTIPGWNELSTSSVLLALLSGPVTVLPMLALVYGMQRVSLQTGALLQYINPALTILMGVVTGESITVAELLAYGLIGLGITIGARPQRSPNQPAIGEIEQPRVLPFPTVARVIARHAGSHERARHIGVR